MASYKSATPLEIVAKGGHYNGETGDNKNKCVTKATATSTWLTNHGATYQNTTGLSYSPTNRVLAIGDVKINSGQSTTVYEFTNYDVPRTLFVRASSRAICDQMQQVITSQGQSWGGAVAAIANGGGNVPVVLYYNEYVPGVELLWEPGTSEATFIQLQGYNQQYVTFMYPRGYVALDGSNNQTVGERSLFSLGTHIVLDFQGQNCRKKYFSFIVGGNEQDVVTYANGGTPAQHPGVSMGWSEPTKQGQNSRSRFNNAEIVRWYSSGNVDQYFDVPDYKSINSVWVSNTGFGVIFKDTADINDNAREVFIVGLNRDNNPATWNTDSDGFIIECINFTMS